MNWRAVGSALPRPRQAFGAAIAVAGLLVIFGETWQAIVFHDPRVAQALLGGLMAAAATALGTVPMLVSRPLSERTQDTLLGFAAGAMLFVVSHEIIPESHRRGHERFATAGLIAGFVVMMFLDTSLG